MSYQIVIINPTGASLRTAPNTGGGDIRRVYSKDGALSVERLIFASIQNFDTDSIEAYLEAEKRGQVMGDVWCQISGLQPYRAGQVTGYIALKVMNTRYGVLAGSPPVVPVGDRESRIAEIDEMIRYLATRRIELSR